MKRILIARFAIIASLLALAPAAPAETLGDKLRDSGFDTIIGTWIDEDTKGAGIKTTYKWRLKDRVIDVTTRAGDTESASLIAVSGESGEVVHVGADNKGGSAIGKWSEEDGDAILEIEFVTEDGEEGEMRIRHQFEDKDTMVVTFEIEDGASSVTLVRAK